MSRCRIPHPKRWNESGGQKPSEQEHRALMDGPRRRSHEELSVDELVAGPRGRVALHRAHLVGGPMAGGGGHGHSLLGGGAWAQGGTPKSATTDAGACHQLMAFRC